MPDALYEPYTCLCGGWAYTREQLIHMSSDDPEAIGWENMWRSLLGAGDLYCTNEDDVLTEPETWRVMGLKLPVHDEDYGLMNNEIAAPWGDVELIGGLIW